MENLPPSKTIACQNWEEFKRQFLRKLAVSKVVEQIRIAFLDFSFRFAKKKDGTEIFGDRTDVLKCVELNHRV